MPECWVCRESAGELVHGGCGCGEGGGYAHLECLTRSVYVRVDDYVVAGVSTAPEGTD